MALEAIIEARAVEKYYEQPHGGRIQVIAPTDLAIHPGTILMLLGPSGSGKSTLLRMLTGLARPSKGEVFWHGRPLDGHVPNVGMVFQSFALYPWLTVLENVEAPLQARAIPPIVERRKRALKMLDIVGLDGFETAYPKELSGGLKEATNVLGIRGMERWRTLILPSIFPYLVTGLVTASGGAWNASIVAEYFHFQGQTIFTLGLGSTISQATDSGNLDLLVAATVAMATIVVTINRLVWRRMYKTAQSKFRLES